MKRQITITLLPVGLVIFCLTFGHMTIAAPGDLDPTFSGDGKLTDRVRGTDNSAHGVAVQPDGKVVTVGSASGNFAIARYNIDGSLDTSFGTDGEVTTDVANSDGASSVAIQPDGKIVAAGSANISYSLFALVRYNTDGSLDTSFDNDGKVTTDFAEGSGVVSVAIQSDGKIVAAGYTHNGSPDDDFALARYNTDGSLDTSFDNDGKVTTAFGSVANAYSVAIQPDGKMVAAGYTYNGSSYDFALVRYNTDGSLDTSFDNDGNVTTDFGSSGDQAFAVAIQPDGKIVAAGYTLNGFGSSDDDFALARYNTDGSLDTSFDNDGKVTTAFGSRHDEAYSVAIQPDGKIVAAGPSYNGSNYDFALARYSTDGSLDTSFDNDGKATTAFGSSDDAAYSVAIQSDGKIVTAGNSYSATSFGRDFALARYNPNGSLDTTFDGDGKVVTELGYRGHNSFSAVIAQPDGKVLAFGSSEFAFAVARYNPEGSPDTTFGGGTGKVRIDGDLSATSVAVQQDGKIVVGGPCPDCSGNGGNDFVVTRYNPEGSKDTSFANGGSFSIGDGGGAAYSVHVLSDGKIIAAGENRIVRLAPNGSLDTTFGGGDGIAYVPIFLFASAIQPDGKIVAAGAVYNGSNYEFAVARCNPDGSLDTSFDSDGVVITPIGIADGAKSVAIQSDGKIVAAGESSDGQVNNLALVRYNVDGSLDTTFDSDGRVLTPLNGANSVAIQRDGRILAATTIDNGADRRLDFCLVRYNPNGSLDNTFSGDGISTVNFNGNSNDRANGMALDSHGRAVVVGASDDAFALARFVLGPGAIPANHTRFDFDGDGRSDVSVFRPSDRVWYLDQSTAGFSATQFGLSTDTITPADFDGDGRTDISVYRDGTWYWLKSSNGSFNARQFGIASDIPVPADYTGDGRDELAVYRNGQWWTLDLLNDQHSLINFGLATDRPVAADYDGDGKTDIAIYRDGTWWKISSGTGSVEAMQFGLASDRPVVGDYDGDSKADLAVYRDGIWYLLRSSQGFAAFQWGLSTDIPAPADYDGDGKTDAAVFRDGIWYQLRSTGGIFTQQFGLAGDKAVPSAFTP